MFIYIIENNLNGKVYVGQTISKNPRTRWRSHVYEAKHNKNTACIVDKAIAKYGATNFNFLVIEAYSSIEELDQAEVYWIDYLRYMLGKTQVYNLLEGGKNGKHSETSKKKMSENSPKYWLGKRLPEEMKQKISQSNSGKVFTETRKQNISKALKGKPSINKGKPKPAGFDKMMSQINKTFTDEQELSILAEYEESKITMKELATKYQVGIGTIHRLINRWKS